MTQPLQRLHERLAETLLCVLAVLLSFWVAGGPALARETVTVWAFPIGADGGRALYDNVVIPKFEEKYPGVDLEIVIHPWADRDERMLVAYASGSGPDIAYLNLDFFPRFIEANMLEPLTRYYTPEILSDYYENAIDTLTFDGEIYGFPILQSLVSYMYNKDLFEQAGLDPNAPPTNWDEVAAVSDTLTRRAGDGTTEQFGIHVSTNNTTTNMTYNPFLWQAGGEIFQPDGRSVAFDEPPGVEALEYMVSFNSSGEHGGDFRSGNVGIQLSIANDTGIAYTRDAPLFEWGIGPVLEHRERVSYGTMAAYAMFNTSEHKETAANALRFMTSTEIMGTLLSQWGYLPPKRSVGPEYFEEYIDWIGVFFDNAAFTHYDVTHPFVRDVYGYLAPAVTRAFNLEIPPSAALEDAARQANAYLSQQMEE